MQLKIMKVECWDKFRKMVYPKKYDLLLEMTLCSDYFIIYFWELVIYFSWLIWFLKISR